jgi:hypothetical protein
MLAPGLEPNLSFQYLPTVTLDKHSPDFSDDKITIRGESQVTLGGLRWKVKGDEGCTYRSRSNMGRKLEKESHEEVIGCQR